jgi:hypothetical protein
MIKGKKLELGSKRQFVCQQDKGFEGRTFSQL